MREFDETWFKDRLHALRKNQAGLARHLDSDKATISYMLRGKRRMKLDEVERVAAYLECDVIEVLLHTGLDCLGDHIESSVEHLRTNCERLIEIDPRISRDHLSSSASNGTGRIWCFPQEFVEKELKLKRADTRLMQVLGDSMNPTLNLGDHVIIDVASRQPTPPGIFAFFDGHAIELRRLEVIINSEPLMVRITPDNNRYMTSEVSADHINIFGRVVGAFCKM